jgi:hypothetical protein
MHLTIQCIPLGGAEAVGSVVGTKLSIPDSELYRRTDEVLHYLWDPCSASDTPQARDEYSSYLPAVFSLLKRGADALAVAEYLAAIERDRMGTSGDASSLMKVASVLVDWRDHIASQYP